MLSFTSGSSRFNVGSFHFIVSLDGLSTSCKQLSVLWSHLDITLLLPTAQTVGFQSLKNKGPGQFCDGGTHPEQVGKSRKIRKSRKNPEMRGTGRGTILLRRDASGQVGKSGKIQKKSEKSGNASNRKGNNFVTAGRIRNKSEKSSNERNRKHNNFETNRETGREGNNFVAIGASGKRRKTLEKSEKTRNERSRKGNRFAGFGSIRKKSEISGKIRK